MSGFGEGPGFGPGQGPDPGLGAHAGVPGQGQNEGRPDILEQAQMQAFGLSQAAAEAAPGTGPNAPDAPGQGEAAASEEPAQAWPEASEEPADGWPEGWNGALDGRGPGSPLVNMPEIWPEALPEGLEEGHRNAFVDPDFYLQLLRWHIEGSDFPEFWDDRKDLWQQQKLDDEKAHWRALSGRDQEAHKEFANWAQVLYQDLQCDR